VYLILVFKERRKGRKQEQIVERRGVHKHEKVPLFEPDQCDEIRSSEYDLSSMIYAKSASIS
jgi:hypothetical protein